MTMVVMERELNRIKLLLLDVDGVMTNCQIFYDGKEWRRFFSIRDGIGIKFLQKQGYKVGIITGSQAEDIRARAKMLSIDIFYENCLDKEPALNEILKKQNLTPEEVAYVGDDVFDIPIIKTVGFGATVADAFSEVKLVAKYITKSPGGMGAVREICELILKHGAYSKGGG